LRFFKKNKAEVDFENAGYQFVKLQETETENDGGQQVLLVIHNPYGLKIRPEKQNAEVLEVSRSQVKKLMEQEEIRVENMSSQSISIYLNNFIM